MSADTGTRRVYEPERIETAWEDGFAPPGPTDVEVDVDDPTDPGSCFRTTSFLVDGNERGVDFDLFEELEWVYVEPFGSYPSLIDLLKNALKFDLDLPGLPSIPDLLPDIFPQLYFDIGNFISFPSLGLPRLPQLDLSLPDFGLKLSDIIPGLEDFLTGLIIDNI